MVNELHLFVFPFILVLVHEFGHYLAAKKEGIYKGWGIFPSPHIKFTQPPGSRWAYLSGFAATLFLFPYWIWVWGWGSFHWFLAFCLAGASIDVALIIMYGRLNEGRKKV